LFGKTSEERDYSLSTFFIVPATIITDLQSCWRGRCAFDYTYFIFNHVI